MPIKTPKIRKLFIPDPGHVLVDVDLSGADAQVVAWEANDDDLKAAFRAGVKIHDKNATDVFGERYTSLPGDRKDGSSPKGRMYDASKRACHGTNYVASAKTLHLTPDIGWPLHECVQFQSRWFALHPGIRDWHNRCEMDLRTKRGVSNAFGYSITYFDRVDKLLPEAVAWIPQSTVALVCRRGGLALRRNCSWTTMLLQVHDSWVFQFAIRLLSERNVRQLRAIEALQRENEKLPTDRQLAIPSELKQLDAQEIFSQIRKHLTIVVPYDDPLIIPWGFSISLKSWGDCEEMNWPV